MSSPPYFYLKIFFDQSICLQYFYNIQKPKIHHHFATLKKQCCQLSNGLQFMTEKWWTSIQDNSPKSMNAIIRRIESFDSFFHFTTRPHVRSHASQLTFCSHLHL